MANHEETIKMPINEPATGKRISQIQVSLAAVRFRLGLSGLKPREDLEVSFPPGCQRLISVLAGVRGLQRRAGGAAHRPQHVEHHRSCEAPDYRRFTLTSASEDKHAAFYL